MFLFVVTDTPLIITRNADQSVVPAIMGSAKLPVHVLARLAGKVLLVMKVSHILKNLACIK